jgi:hypothetical protein
MSCGQAGVMDAFFYCYVCPTDNGASQPETLNLKPETSMVARGNPMGVKARGRFTARFFSFAGNN